MFHLKSKVAREILGFFLLNPHEQRYVNDLARILELDPSNTDRKLKELEREGILHSESRGNQRYYLLNAGYPLLEEIKKLYETKYGLPYQLAALLKGLDGLEEAYIFGSYAAGTQDPQSDVDVLLIGHHNTIEARRALLKFEKRYGREFNAVDMERAEFELRTRAHDDFLKNVFEHKTIRIL